GAAALGGFSSLPITYLGGLLIGVGASLATRYFTSGLLSGLAASLPFLVLFVVLLVAPRRKLVERAPVVPRGHSGWTAPWQIQSGFGLPVLTILLFVPNFAGIHLADFSQFLALTVLFLSLGLLVRTSGQVSLCHISFMAVGVCAFSHLHVDHHWPWFIALLAAGGVAVPIGALLAIPAIRLSGLYLALATFGFGILMQYMFYSEGYMFGPDATGLSIPKPHISWLGLTDSDKSYYYLCLAVAVLVTGGMLALNRSRLGRLSRALADSPRGLATSGTSTHVTRVLVFCLSAFLAAIAGVLAAGALGQVGGELYQPINSLLYFAVVVITVGGAPWYAIGAAVGLTLLPSYWANAEATNWLQLAFGVVAVLYAVTPSQRRGVPEPVTRAIDRLVRRHSKSAAQAVTPSDSPTSSSRVRLEPGQLRSEDIRVAFGGLVAVDGVSLEAPTGRITGLIGPNGAGKTTLFNACSGLNNPSRGRVLLDGAVVSRLSPARRARRGLGRTFQQMELFDNLTVWENVALGAEASNAGANPLRHIASSRATKRVVTQRATAAIEQCDLRDLVDRTVGTLSTGQRRLVELARCLAGPFRILLLDEPSSGLDRVETARFGEVLQRAVAERGIGILLVEHDMALVTDVCEYIYVLDFGRLIFEGTSAEVMSAPIVQAAYLGDDGALGTDDHRLEVREEVEA
ncbi:MAG: Sulfate-transporting ATPase, partial [Pseudonocardiales bacterium]|nr:Sulfate-transporting ATPase [Pseudonocardiales bacterium]